MPDVPYGYCECGCGQKTRLAPKTATRLGHVKGEPMRFILGHGHVPKLRVPCLGVDYIEDPETGCWVWQWALDWKGYGKHRVDGKKRAAHRVVYEQHVGPIPDGLQLDHLCRNRRCVNPEHLEPVTGAENCRRGKTAKLTLDDAREIRRSSESLTALARRFGVSRAAINQVRAGKTWREH